MWEDDPVQANDPLLAGGANRVSLAEARSNYARFGASEGLLTCVVRPATDDERGYPVG